MFKIKYILRRYRLRHTTQMDDEVTALELTARYKAIDDLRKKIDKEPTVTNEKVKLKLIKQEALEKHRVKIE